MGDRATSLSATPEELRTVSVHELSNSTRTASFSWILGFGLLVVLAVCVELTTGWKSLLAPWLEISVSDLMWASVLLFASYAVRTIRIHRYFKTDIGGHYLSTLRVVGLHNVFNNLLPMRSGEASFPILMRRDFGVPFMRSVPGLMYLRLLDIHAILLVGVALITWTWGPTRWLLLASISLLPLVGFWGQERLRLRLTSRSRAGSALLEGLSGLPGTAGEFGWTWFWTGVNWALKLSVLGFVLRAFAPLRYTDALIGSIAGELSSVLPLHGVAGAGTYEGGVVAGLVATGSQAKTVLAGAVNLHLFVLGVSMLGGLLALFLPAGPHARIGVPELRRASLTRSGRTLGEDGVLASRFSPDPVGLESVPGDYAPGRQQKARRTVGVSAALGGASAEVSPATPRTPERPGARSRRPGS